LALLLTPFAAPGADEVLIDGFNEHQWINEFGFGGTRNTDPLNGALMKYFEGVSNGGGNGSMGYTITGLNEETGWAGIFPHARDWNSFIGDNREMRFRLKSAQVDVRVDSPNGNRPPGYKLEVNGQPGGYPNGIGPIRPENFGEWTTISWEPNAGLTIDDPGYQPFFYVTRPAITLNYDNGANTPDDPGFTTGDFTVYFDNYMINGEMWDDFESKPRGRTRYASRTDFVSYDQPYRTTTGIQVHNTQFANVFVHGPDIDPEMYLEFDDEFGPGNETGTAGLFQIPTPSEGNRLVVLTWSSESDAANEGADAQRVGISTNYYSDPVDLTTAESVKVDVYVPNFGQTALPASVILSLVDDNVITDVQIGDASSSTLSAPITQFNQWTTLTFPMDSFVNVVGDGPDLSRVHHIELAFTGAGAAGDTDTGRLFIDNLRLVEQPVVLPEFLVDGFDAPQWWNTFGFGGTRNTDPPNGALMRYFQGPDVSNGGNGSMGFSVLGLNNTTGFAGIFPNARENNAFIGEQRQTRYRLADGSFDVKIVSSNGNRPWTFKYEINGQSAGQPNGGTFTGPLNFNEWYTKEWSVNGALTPDDEGYIFFFHITRAGITLNYGGTSVDGGDAFATGDFLVYFDNYTINGQVFDDFENKPRGRSLVSNRGGVSYTQPYRSTTGVNVFNTQFPNLFEYGPGVDEPFVVEFDDEFDPESPSGVPGLLGLPAPSQGDRYMMLTWSADDDAANAGADAGIVGLSNNYYSEPVDLLGAEEIRVDVYIPNKVQTALPGSVILTLIDDNLIDGVQLGDAASSTLASPVTAFNEWTTLTFPIDSLVNVGANPPDLSRIHHLELAFINAGGVGANDSGRILIDNIRYAGTDIVTPPDLGDVTGDGVVNVADVTALANAIAGGSPPPAAVGDINGDTFVNEADVQALADAIADGSI
jgi:hypothetical protein